MTKLPLYKKQFFSIVSCL